MKSLAEGKSLIAESDKLEVGCGADRGLISALMRREVKAVVGIDLEPGPNNQDLILTELELKFKPGLLSCYPYYPGEISNVWQAAEFLRSQLEADKVVGGIRVLLEEIRKLKSQAEVMSFKPSLSLDKVADDRVLEGDAQTLLEQASGKEFGTIFADSFLHTFDEPQIKKWSELMRARLRLGGKLIVIQRIRDNIGKTIQGVTASGLAQVESAPLDAQTRPITSHRTRQIIGSGMSDNYYRLVYQNV